MTTYKVWVQVERINEDKDIYENVGEPDQAGEFKSLQDAERFAGQLTGIGDVIADSFKSYVA